MDDQFKSWLVCDKELGNKSARDVVSRLKRVNSIMTIDLSSQSHRQIYDLSQIDQFMNLTITVKSQLRRAINLYFEYAQIVKNTQITRNH